MVSDTLHIPPSGRVVGEGLTVLMLAANSSGFGAGSYKPVLLVDVNASSVVWLADLSVWNAYCGNEGAVLLSWGAGVGSGLWDVNMLVSATVGAKMVVAGDARGEGAGYSSNLWLAATTAYFLDTVRAGATPPPTQLLQAAVVSSPPPVPPPSAWERGVEAAWGNRAASLADALLPFHQHVARTSSSTPAAAVSTPLLPYSPAAAAATGTAAPAPAATCPFTQIGVLVGSSGPFFWVGSNFEHALVAELGLMPGAANHIFFGVEAEESERALTLNGTHNVVVYNGLFAFWNVSIGQLPAQAVAQRAAGEGPLPYDLAYRLVGMGVPLPASEQALLLDVSDGGRGFSVPLGSAPASFARAAAVLLTVAH